MPRHYNGHTPAEALTIRANREERPQAESDCISQLVREGRTEEQAAAECQDQADKATGTKTPFPR